MQETLALVQNVRAESLGKVDPLLLWLACLDPGPVVSLSSVCLCVCLEVLPPELPEPRASLDGSPGPRARLPVCPGWRVSRGLAQKQVLSHSFTKTSNEDKDTHC